MREKDGEYKGARTLAGSNWCAASERKRLARAIDQRCKNQQ